MKTVTVKFDLQPTDHCELKVLALRSGKLLRDFMVELVRKAIAEAPKDRLEQK